MSAWHYLIKGYVVIKAFENTKQWINRLGSFFPPGDEDIIYNIDD